MPDSNTNGSSPTTTTTNSDSSIGHEQQCTPEEYENLLSLAKSLTPTDIPSEFLECSRYGEIDAVRAILDVHASTTTTTTTTSSSKKKKKQQQQRLIDTTDSQGSTALHKACANGHASTVSLLLSHNATFSKNHSGNTPLHWAAANGHERCVALLLSKVTTIDVLEKNNYGRSALTEGFTSQNTKVVGLLLEHESSSEEKLLNVAIPVKKGATGTAAKDGEEEEEKGVVHEFLFYCRPKKEGDEQTVRIRELPITNADNPFGDENKPQDDTTGLGIWCASLVMARWVSSPSLSKRLKGKTILELGAGCAVPGLAASVYGRPKSVTLTDLNPQTMKNIQHNISLNDNNNKNNNDSHAKSPPLITSQSINWADASTYPPQKFDVILGSDLVYQSSLVPLLHAVISHLLSPCGVFLYVAPVAGRDGLNDFLTTLTVVEKLKMTKRMAPKEYGENPLKSGDEADCFLHFGELRGVDYVLYEFSRC